MNQQEPEVRRTFLGSRENRWRTQPATPPAPSPPTPHPTPHEGAPTSQDTDAADLARRESAREEPRRPQRINQLRPRPTMKCALLLPCFFRCYLLLEVGCFLSSKLSTCALETCFIRRRKRLWLNDFVSSNVRILTHVPSHSSKRTHSYQVRNECAPPTTPAQHFEPPFCRPVYLILLLSFTRSIHPFSLVLSAHLDSHVAHASSAHLPLASIIRNSSRICGDGTGPAYPAKTFTCAVIFTLCSMLIAIKVILFSVFCACRSSTPTSSRSISSSLFSPLFISITVMTLSINCARPQQHGFIHK